MTQLVKADSDELLRRVRSQVDHCVRQVMTAVNDARDGYLIDDSEVQANRLLNDLKRQVYEAALQARLDASEASFSPSGRRGGTSKRQQRDRGVFSVDVAGTGADTSASIRTAGPGQRQSAGRGDRSGGQSGESGGS
ncbi:MAG: hypothetical protein WC000_13065 [Dokdonella sp.]